MNEKKPLFFDIEEQEWVDAPQWSPLCDFPGHPAGNYAELGDAP